MAIAMVLGVPHGLHAAGPSEGIVRTKDALTIHSGTYVCTDGSLKAVAHYNLYGSFFDNRFVSPKFPCGGALLVGASTPPLSAISPHLNPDAVLAFNGGYLFLAGQGLDEKAFARGKPVVVEQVKQIQFLSGMSEIRLENGNEVSGCTTLLAVGPNRGVVRNQGAAVMVGGDEKRTKAGLNTAAGVQPGFSAALGVAEKIVFAGGMGPYLKGAGGPPGSTNRSVIPWITVGTYLRPGMGGVATYDAEKGVHCLAPGEYDKKIRGTPDRNVWVESTDLGENQAQTVNALVFIPYYSCQIGSGSTLTITSGFLQFGQRGPSAIGSHPQGGDYNSTGTLDFGPAEGIIWTCFEAEWGPNIIGPAIAGSGGLTIAGSNTLVLHGANTYTGKTCVSGGTLQVGDVFPTKARLGKGDVQVAAGATLRIMSTVSRAIAADATVTLLSAGGWYFGVMDLQAGVHETVGDLVLAGQSQPAGTYGSSRSPATHKFDNYFTGPGVLTVTAGARGAKAVNQ
jgi:autotransporter-associated beta strand protein